MAKFTKLNHIHSRNANMRAAIDVKDVETLIKLFEETIIHYHHVRTEAYGEGDMEIFNEYKGRQNALRQVCMRLKSLLKDSTHDKELNGLNQLSEGSH